MIHPEHLCVVQVFRRHTTNTGNIPWTAQVCNKYFSCVYFSFNFYLIIILQQLKLFVLILDLMRRTSMLNFSGEKLKSWVRINLVNQVWNLFTLEHFLIWFGKGVKCVTDETFPFMEVYFMPEVWWSRIWRTSFAGITFYGRCVHTLYKGVAQISLMCCSI